MIIRYIILIGTIFFTTCAQPQSNDLGGSCDGCEAIYEYGNKVLKSTDSLPGFFGGRNKIKVCGTVFKLDGKTPADNIILYVYHTDSLGKYPVRETSTGWESRHGYLRGWLKTDVNGYYEFYTNRPASYPNSSLPQHIHITVKEPNKKAYYVEDFYFSDDPNLKDNIRTRTHARGGSGVIELDKKHPIMLGKRNIILGLNIPNYSN